MVVGAGADRHGTATDDREKPVARVEVVTNDPRCWDALPLEAITAAVPRAGMRLSPIEATLTKRYRGTPTLGERPGIW